MPVKIRVREWGTPVATERTIELLFNGCRDILGQVDSNVGHSVPEGITRRVSVTYPGVNLRTDVEPSAGFSHLRSELESGEAKMLSDKPDLVLLSVVGEADRLTIDGPNVEQSIREITDDLVACIGLIKARVGAHVLVANLSTLDPGNSTFNYHGLDKEPFSLRAHRLNRVLVSVSREEGISIIDVDRKIAERGGEDTVVGPARYNEEGLKVIAGEIFRVIEDYGFLDERPILEQIGAGSGGKQ